MSSLAAHTTTRNWVRTTLRAAPAVASRRCAPAAAGRWASTEQPPQQDGSSFKGQMMESIAARMQREKAERERAARMRQQSSGSRNWTVSFMLLTTAIGCWYLGTKYPRDIDPSSTLPLSASPAPKHDTGKTNLQAAWADFAAVVGKENVNTNESVLETHATSDWTSHKPETTHHPFCVIYPATTEEVSQIMKICHARRIPVTPYSGGTSLEGHFTPEATGVCIDFGRMDKIVALHKEDLDVVVQPAVGWELLNEELAKSNLFFPPDPGPGAMIGGMIGTGCSGTNAYRYGTMRDWVLSLTVVLADGTVIKTRQRPRKSSAGYDLTRLFIGGEGTLGLVTEATLKLTVLPPSTSVAVATFPSIRHAANCVAEVVGNGIPVAAVEILDENQMRFINLAGATTRSWKESPTLFFKFSGTPSGVKEQVAIVEKMARRAGNTSFDFARNHEEQLELWSARKEALWSTIAGGKPGDQVWTTDVAVPISRLPDIIEETKRDIGRTGLANSIVGHVGDGNFHLIILFGEKEREIAEECVHRMVKRAVEMEGTVTGEHGVGLVKRDYLPHELGVTTVDMMRKLKQAFDPLYLLNPDHVVRVKKPRAGEVSEW
ncbi:hypothetical protein GE09DRAFT_181680 [Coniochaeta sp. 2T2.1]|nr:hypothetical protein GE09DRAFT_181680 [Coniochaeta sp. 2T2.1]